LGLIASPTSQRPSSCHCLPSCTLARSSFKVLLLCLDSSCDLFRAFN
jgi:hypothetical protein